MTEAQQIAVEWLKEEHFLFRPRGFYGTNGRVIKRETARVLIRMGIAQVYHRGSQMRVSKLTLSRRVREQIRFGRVIQ